MLEGSSNGDMAHACVMRTGLVLAVTTRYSLERYFAVMIFGADWRLGSRPIVPEYSAVML